ncbi:hypothetical protein AAY473_011465 [Plecturocebus cupreus]
MLVDSSIRGSCLERTTTCCHNRWSILPGSGVPMESWSQCGLASMVHLMLAGGSGWGSCLQRPGMCCHNRWLILLSNRVPMESWSQCGLASMVHLMLAVAQDEAVVVRVPLPAGKEDGWRWYGRKASDHKG